MSLATPLEVHELDFVSHSDVQTRRLGLRMGRLLQSGDVLLLEGQFGTGKTTFVQGVGEGLGVRGPITSPSFTLVWAYEADAEHGGISFYHIDLYRITSLAEALSFGLDEYLYGEGVCAVEWADRVPGVAPEGYLRIHLSYLSETKRVVRMEPLGERYVDLLNDFKRSAFGA